MGRLHQLARMVKEVRDLVEKTQKDAELMEVEHLEQLKEDISEKDEDIAEQTKLEDDAAEKVQTAKTEFTTCTRKYSTAKGHFDTQTTTCVSSHALFSRQWNDNDALLKLIERVFEIVENRITHKSKTHVHDAITNAVRNHATGATGAEEPTGSVQVPIKEEPKPVKPITNPIHQCPMPKCMRPKPPCKLVPSDEKRVDGCPRYPCGKMTCS